MRAAGRSVVWRRQQYTAWIVCTGLFWVVFLAGSGGSSALWGLFLFCFWWSVGNWVLPALLRARLLSDRPSDQGVLRAVDVLLDCALLALLARLELWFLAGIWLVRMVAVECVLSRKRGGG